MSQGAFRQDFHNLRAVAITLIVGAHTLPSFNWSDHPLLFRVIDTLCNESSVIFFFIAGFLFHHLSGRFKFAPYLRNKGVNVILPYLLLSLPAIILWVYLIPKYNAPWNMEPAWYQFMMYYITGRQLAPLWFVPTITLFYLAAPLFLFADRKAPWVYWTLPLFIALSAYIGREALWGPIGKAVYLFPAYFAGLFVSHYRDAVEAFVRKFLWPLAAACAVIYVAMVLQILPKSAHIVLKLLFGLILLQALRALERPIGTSFDYVADISFGIFFVHAYILGAIGFAVTRFIDGSYATGQDAVMPGTLGNYLLLTAVVLALSTASIWVCQKVLGARSRMLVGA